MSTQFSSTISLGEKTSENDYVIRTMQDDLLDLGSKKDFSAPTKENIPLENTAPIKKEIPVPQKPTPFEQLPSVENSPKKTINPNPVVPIKNTQKNPFETSPVLTEVPVAETEDSFSEKNTPNLKLIFSVIAILLLSISGLGGYYFWITKTPQPIVEPAQIIEPVAIEPTIEEPTVTIETPEEKYSSEKPNYLTIDTNSLSSAEIKSLLLTVSEEIKVSNSIAPIEFIVVDNNNNPITFQIFAIATDLKFSPEILSSLDSAFSLFIFKDTTNTHLAFASSIKNNEVFAKEILKQEKTLSSDLSLLFLDLKPTVSATSFNSSSYGNKPVRYLNLISEGELSVDYAVFENHFILGTSKNTLRSVLDKLSTAKNVPTNSSEPISSIEKIETKEAPVSTQPIN